MGAVPREAGADVEGAVDVAAEGGQRLHVRLHGVQQVVAAVAAAHQQAGACMYAPKYCLLYGVDCCIML